MATTAPAFIAPVQELAPAEPRWRSVTRRFLKHKLAVAGLATLLLLAIAVYVGPLVSPYAFDGNDLTQTGHWWPSLQHWLGTDELGRDVLTRLLYAGRISMTVGLIVALLSVLLGTLVGAFAGYFGSWVDAVSMRLVDVIQSVPLLMLLMVLVAFLGHDLRIIVLVIALTSWTGVARLVRGEILALKGQEFVEAAHAVGVGSMGQIFRHLIPNALAPVFVSATLGVADAITLESALSFLGVGIQPPIPSWGNLLTDAQQYLVMTPWLAFYPGLLIFLTVASINFVGDGLRDALDPKLKQ
ncbi:MAG TPA: ABC transporter permease [Stenomitos sp.]